MDSIGMRTSKRVKSHDGQAHPRETQSNGQMPQLLATTVFISNLHCPSCVNTIEEAITHLSPRPVAVWPSVVSHSVTVSHYSTLPVSAVTEALEAGGFDIHSAFQEAEGSQPQQILPERNLGDNWEDSLEQAVSRWRSSWRLSKGKEKEAAEAEAMTRRERHAAQCPECRAELRGGAQDELPLTLTQQSVSDGRRFTQWPSVLDSKTRPPVPASPLALHSQSLSALSTKESYDDAVETVSSRGSEEKKFGVVVTTTDLSRLYRAELSIVGMTCSSCVGAITAILEAFPWIRSVNVALLTNSATVEFEGGDRADDVVTAIEDAGFDANVESLVEVKAASKKRRQSQILADTWQASYAIGGMTCSACVGSITDLVKQLEFVETVNINLISHSGTVTFRGKANLSKITETIADAGFDVTLDNIANKNAELEDGPVERTVSVRINGMYCHHCIGKVIGTLEDKYLKRVKIDKEPSLPDPILRIQYVAAPPDLTIRAILETIREADAAFEPSIYHPPTIEEKSRELAARERRRILFRLALSITAAIPAFILGIVAMSLLKEDNPMRRWVMEPVWAGSVSRVQWALFILATPVYFFAADTFHRKAIKEVKTLWRPGSKVPLLRRFVRFGSMNMLMSLGTTIAYVSSIAELIMAAMLRPTPGMDIDTINSSFYFDSVIFLAMFLLIGRFLEAYSKAKTGDAVTSLGMLRPTEATLIEGSSTKTVAVDLLEVGDTVRVTHGASPPFDGTILDSNSSFDESSLTGESRLVPKAPGDTVFSGTVNKGSPVSIRLSSVSGTSMLDQIIKVVREGQTKRAPVERAADMITSHFVPFVVAIGIITFLTWIALGTSGALPRDWLDVEMGGWPLWALKFAIAVFVVACPCGIGLAAPTALFVGGGMAAKCGILVKGGGEAFQEASMLDCIVFDKTGTLTAGGEPKVTDYRVLTDDVEAEVLGMAMALEEQSGHPIARAVVSLCREKGALPLEASNVEELPGMGIGGAFKLNTNTESLTDADVLVGNERLMDDNDVDISLSSWNQLQSWKQEGKSVVLVATRERDPFSDTPVAATFPKDGRITNATQDQRWTLSAIFAIADALRPEAAPTVAALQSRGIAVWMLSGDNPTTAQAVAAQVGIHPSNVIAGVLPDQKAEKIQYLQRSLPFKPRRGKTHATVAMVGDGINDSPALTMADVGVAIGSGSDVALSSAEFVLISSNLESMLTLIDLSRAVFRRIWFNFGWALVYNLIAMPVAAGVLYPIKTGSGSHIRLDPVWASLAMALSSVSVVSSSLLLRSKIPFVGFREMKMV